MTIAAHERCLRHRGETGAGHEACIPLTTDAIPSADDGWDPISAFALTFDGYGHLGNDACADLANATRGRFFGRGGLPEDLASLRSCLFFEQRRFRFLGEFPGEDDLIYLGALLDAIRHAVS